jgi:hypothetical protein
MRGAGLALRPGCRSTGRRDLGRVRVPARGAAVALNGRATPTVATTGAGDEGGPSSSIRSAATGVRATSGAGAGETAAGGGAAAEAAGAGAGRGGSNVSGST